MDTQPGHIAAMASVVGFCFNSTAAAMKNRVAVTPSLPGDSDGAWGHPEETIAAGRTSPRGGRPREDMA